MQTKSQIQQLLEARDIFPKKRFGQHFLIDLNLMRLLIQSADIQKDDIVLEVGCGTGSLTEALAEKTNNIIAVEIDKTLAEIARNQLGGKKNVQIVNADILSKKSVINPNITQVLGSLKKSDKGRILLVANLPYNAASPLMFNLAAGPVITDAMYVTVQKEVAQRIAASPGNKDYGTLSVLLQATGEVKIIRSVPPASFWPRPKVDSVMLSFERNCRKAARIKNVQILTSVINLFMQHRRKMLKAIVKFAPKDLQKINNLPHLFEDSGIDPQLRPEMLKPEDYIRISNRLSEEGNE